MRQVSLFSESELNKHETANSVLAGVGGSVSYTIRDTECNSRIFGDCEICGKPVAQVHHQVKWKEIFNSVTGKNGKIQLSDGYGHYQCLLSVR